MVGGRPSWSSVQMEAASDQDSTIFEQSGRVIAASRGHVANEAEGSRGRIVKLRACIGSVGKARLPVINTMPSGRSVAVWVSRALVISPVRVKVPVDGSYSLESGVHRELCRATGKQYLAVREQGRRASPEAICACKTERAGCRIVELGNVRRNIFTIIRHRVGATGNQDSPVGEQRWNRQLQCGAQVGVRAGGSECAGSRIIDSALGVIQGVVCVTAGHQDLSIA